MLEFLAAGLTDATWWQVVLFTLVTSHITIASVTIFLHRSMAHRALDLHAIPQHFFRAWLWLTTGMVTREWTAVHRKHHAKCETTDDPHSPVTFGLRKVLLEGAELYRIEAANRETVDKYGRGVPEDWIERKLYTPYSYLGIYLALAIDIALFGVIGVSVWAVQMLWIPILAAGVINGLGHARGYRNFDSADASTNIVPIGLLIGGEELHNNHHTYPTSAKFSAKWYEFDVGWLYIRILSAFGLANVKKVMPKPQFVATRPGIDLEALQAVLHHRYDVMATYASALKRACADEAERLKTARNPSSRLLKSARRWVHLDGSRLHAHQSAKLGEVLAASDLVRKLVEMRAELSAIWERSSHSGEQLVTMLQQWCHNAEKSGIKALQDMSLRLRSYASAPSPSAT